MLTNNLLNAQNEICLYGFCGEDPWGGQYFTALDVMVALAQVGAGGSVTVRLNSPGGYASEGVAVYNALRAYAGQVTIKVDGCAYSAASVVMCAGNKIIMLLGATAMIHDPSAITIGTQDDHQKAMAMLQVLGDAVAAIYAAKTGQSIEDCRADMVAELWMTAQDAVDKGYADQVEEGDTLDPTPFNYTLYQHPPKQLATMTAAKGWVRPMLKGQGPVPNPNPLPSPGNNPLDVDPTLRVDPLQPSGDPTMPTPAELAAQQAALVTAQAQANQTAVARATEIATLCATEGFPQLAASMIGSDRDINGVRAHLSSMKEVKLMVDAARKHFPTLDANLADQYIAAGTSPQGVKADLFDRTQAIQSAGPKTVTAHGALASGTNEGPARNLDAATIYGARAKLRQGRVPGRVDLSQ